MGNWTSARSQHVYQGQTMYAVGNRRAASLIPRPYKPPGSTCSVGSHVQEGFECSAILLYVLYEHLGHWKGGLGSDSGSKRVLPTFDSVSAGTFVRIWEAGGRQPLCAVPGPHLWGLAHRQSATMAGRLVSQHCLDVNNLPPFPYSS